MKRFSSIITLLGLIAIASSQNYSALQVPIDRARTQGDISGLADQSVRRFNLNASILSEKHRHSLLKAGRYDRRLPLSFPTTVFLVRGGQLLRGQANRPYGSAGLTLSFDSTGSRAFPSAYQTLLQNVFSAARPTMDLIFSTPASSGPVLVKNYDADIGDRDAVAGGYYLPNNGSGGREIRFPVYSSPEAAAVNFVHTLLLAYQGSTPYGYDAFQEGIVRAAVMKVMRTPSALASGLDPDLIESALQNSYDVGPDYDWYNQPALSGSRFIAPNLRSVDLPTGGSVGGLYLLRYQMAGSAWSKALTENAGFIAEMNRRFYAAPGSASNVSALITMGQAALNTVKGAANSTIEGKSFSDWFKRQFVLDTTDTVGRKVLVQPLPLPPVTGTSDFGVYDVVAHYFETLSNGNELLLSATSFPIFWDSSYNRIFPSTQEDRMDIAGAYGSVAPNFPDLVAGQSYRVAIDIPVLDRLARMYVPAGAIARGSTAVTNNFYGTVIGLSPPTGAAIRMRLKFSGTIWDSIAIRNGAFGDNITATGFDQAQRVTIEVIQTVNAVDSIIFSRVVNKGLGALGVDLRIGGDVPFALSGGLTKGMSLIGFPVEPYNQNAGAVLGIALNQVLAARYNPSRAAYDLFPDSGPFTIGGGYFLRLNAANGAWTVEGRSHPKSEMSVALRPGWNLITTPINENVPTNRIRVVKAAGFPETYAEAAGTDLGLDFFQFVPGANDAATGAPETGTLAAATSFQPGVGYYVRCLAPEGATMVFAPSTPSVSSPRSSEGPHTAEDGWLARVLVNGGGRNAIAWFGQSSSALRSIDRSDSLMPPRFVGGFQAWFQSGSALYRDIRHWGEEETYLLRLDGLAAGQTYTISISFVRGQVDKILLDDPSGQFRGVMPLPGSYRFAATSSTRVINLILKRGLK